MPHVTAALGFIQAHWPVISTVLVAMLPSVITALSQYPKTDNLLKMVLDVLSVLTHRDSPGTIKLPFQRSQAPTVVGSAVVITGVPVIAGAPLPPKGFVGLATLLVLTGSMALTQVVSSGPSLAFMEFRPGQVHPVQVAAGAGYQVSVGFFQRSILGAQYDLLDLGATAYGSAVSTPSGTEAGALSIAAFVGTLNEIVGVGVGEDLFGPSGGLFAGSPGKPYLTFMLNLQRFALGIYSPPTYIDAGAKGLPRGLTTYIPL